MHKYFRKAFVIFLALLVMPTIVLAANNVTFSDTTNLYLSTQNLTLTVTGNVDTLAIDASTITVTTCASCTVTIKSTDKVDLINTYGASVQCATTYSYITVTTAASQAFTVTPSNDVACAASGPGGGGGGGGGGGAAPTKPTNTSALINSDVAETPLREVTLTLAATNASLMLISNLEDFSDVTVWEDFAETKSWTLTEGEGEKTVYVKFRSSSGGESDAVSDTITYDLEAVVEEPEEPSVSVPAGLIPGGLTKSSLSSTTYYYGNDGKRYIFFNVKVYNSWYSDFSGIISASTDEVTNLPLAGLVTYRPGVRMVKIQSDPKVYAIAKGGVLRWVKTESVARELYGEDWNQQIDDVPETLFFAFTVGEDIENASQYNIEAEMNSSRNVNEDKGL